MQKDVKNSTTVYFADELLENEKELAKQFSEGCLELESLLLYCWQNGILTRGCCTGHRTKRYSLVDKTATGGHGYISFDIDNKEFAKQLSLNILRNDFLKNVSCRKYDEILVKSGEIGFSQWNHRKEGWFGISYYFPNTYSHKISGQVFNELKNCLDNSLNTNLQPQNKFENFVCYMIDEIFLSTHRDYHMYLNLSTMEFEKNHDFIQLKHLYKKKLDKEKNELKQKTMCQEK